MKMSIGAVIEWRIELSQIAGYAGDSLNVSDR